MVAAYGKPAWRSRFWVGGRVGACDALLLEQAVQKVGVAELLARCAVQPIR
jgi:hypothetical protein